MTMQINVFTFKNRYPELADTGDDKIQNFIDLAVAFHDQSIWAERDYPLAIMLWSAHMMTLYKQQQEQSLSEGETSADTFVNSISFGERRVSFGKRGLTERDEAFQGPGEAQLNNTVYGGLYLQVRARNIIPCLIV